MAANKSVGDIVADYRKRAAAFSYDERRRRSEDPRARALHEKTQQAGFALLAAAAEGREEPEGAREQLLLLGKTDAPAYLCPKCQDKGLIGDKYCSCLRRCIYIEHNGAYDPLLGPCNLDTLDLLVYDDVQLDPRVQVTQRKMASLALGAAKDLVANTPGMRRGMLFQGVPGIGKSWFLRAIARQAAEKDVDVAFFHANVFFDQYLRKRLGERVDTSLLETAELLILDDLGAEASTRNVTIEALLHVVSFRSEKGLPTVIATNEMNLQQRYGERISSRLYAQNDYLTVQLVGNDLRSPSLPA